MARLLGSYCGTIINVPSSFSIAIICCLLVTIYILLLLAVSWSLSISFAWKKIFGVFFTFVFFNYKRDLSALKNKFQKGEILLGIENLVAINLVNVIFNLQSIFVSELMIETKLLQVENNIDQIK